jgi:hypothetical protein
MEVMAPGLLPQEAIVAARVCYFPLRLHIPRSVAKCAKAAQIYKNILTHAEVLPASDATFIPITRHNILMNTKKGEAAWKAVPD